MTRFEVQALVGAGVQVSMVSERTGVSERSVHRIAGEEPIEDPAAVDRQRAERMGRPSAVRAYAEQVGEWLRAAPELRSGQVLERLREAGYQGSKTAAYDLVRQVRVATPPDGVVRFEGVPGEFSQHDFGQVEVRYADGTRERLKFFASCLKFSRLRRVLLVADETTETICHSLVDAFTYFGGVPLMSVFDNPRTIVASRDGERVKWHETFAQFCVEARILPRVTWPYRPQEKGAIENGVGYVKSSFFKAHVFAHRADLEARLAEWHQRVNDERPSRATGEVPRAQYLLEQPRLRPLGVGAQGLRLRYTRIVRSDGFVEFGGVRYFAGLSSVGLTATLHVERERLAVWVGGTLRGTHPRRPVNGKYSVLPEQRGELLEKSGAKPYVMRQLLLDLCPAAAWYITELRHRRPLHWEDQVGGLYALLDEFGECAVRDAFIAAAQRELVGAEYLEAILRGQVASDAEVRR